MDSVLTLLRRREDGVSQRLQIPCPIMPSAVDEKGWRSINPASDAALEVLLHARGKRMLIQVMGESLHIQPRAPRHSGGA